MAKRQDIRERLMRRVEVSDTGCWLWTATTTANGYGKTSYLNRGWLAHRLMYEATVGPIPAGLTLDHLCRVRNCINPEHLEPVTQRTNTLRGDGPSARQARRTHCDRGHLYDDANTRVRGGTRYCRACDRERQQESKARKRAERERAA